ncbi:MAG: hypothetical protein AAFR30_17650, partial [Cyanobacteria bacterium J06628_4]
ELMQMPTSLAVTRQLQARWFGEASRYMNHLAQTLSEPDLATIRQAYKRELITNITWETSIVLVSACLANPPQKKTP